MQLFCVMSRVSGERDGRSHCDSHQNVLVQSPLIIGDVISHNGYRFLRHPFIDTVLGAKLSIVEE